MIHVVISLIYTAHAVLKAEIEQRQKQAADVNNLLKVLHTLESSATFLRDGDAAGLEATVFALNKAVDATKTDEAIVVRKNEVLSADKLAKVQKLVKDNEGKAK